MLLLVYSCWLLAKAEKAKALLGVEYLSRKYVEHVMVLVGLEGLETKGMEIWRKEESERNYIFNGT